MPHHLSSSLPLISIPELSSEVLMYLWPSQLLKLHLVSKAFEGLCAPLVTIPIRATDLILEFDNLLHKLPNLDTLHIMDDYNFDFELFLAALDTWTKLKTVNVQVCYFRARGQQQHQDRVL
ncbi:hypothetical protein BGZ96_011720 [Linnemannia gamsii]|uniref:F-box domain-containing protein n=1 Tax=Linnemannia gamsii TaxID=64522 RepID=A0ABQ7KB28_9FUNG|nr:hypothetical protein BGZ96_011720 [Linnemannia gamsii]